MEKLVDRRTIFLLVALSLIVPLVFQVNIPPARMHAAEQAYQVIESIPAKKDSIALVALDFGPNTKAENEFQAEVVIEHLMRRRVPLAVFSLYPLSAPFLVSIPERVAARLNAEFPGERWEYGKDWVNLGYRFGGYLQIKAIPKSDNIAKLFGEDVRGNKLERMPIFKNIKTFNQISFIGQLTGLTGVFDAYVQFFRSKDYVPPFVHGCTAITIPEAFIYLESGQLSGLLEGISGAAWYSKLLSDNYTTRTKADKALALNTGLGVAHLVIILLVVAGNLHWFITRRRRR